MSSQQTATSFVDSLSELADAEQREKYSRFFPGDDSFIGVRMGAVFDLAKNYLTLAVDEIEQLLESPVHEVRAGACSIMGKAATHKKTDAERHRALYELYLRRHDRIDTWDLVDLAAHQVVGTWLLDKPREPLYTLAVSSFWPERRSAIVATAAFIRRGEVDDTFNIARTLLADGDVFVQKGAGWMLRYAGDVARPALIHFLDEHAAEMPSAMLSYASEKLDKPLREQYRRKARSTAS